MIALTLCLLCVGLGAAGVLITLILYWLFGRLDERPRI